MKKKYIAFNIAIITVALLLFFGFGISVTRSNLYDEAGRIITGRPISFVKASASSTVCTTLDVMQGWPISSMQSLKP